MDSSFGFPLEAVIVLFSVVSVSVWMDLAAHKNKTEVSLKGATAWSVFWVALAVAFYFYLDLRFGGDWASLFLAGYVLEKSLSVDNMMVFVAIFASFGIKGIMQHRILYYGIIGALVFRAIFIAVGTTLFGLAAWVELIFALIVALSDWALFASSGEEHIEDYSDHWAVRFTKRLVPVVPRLVGKRFFIGQQELARLKKDDDTLVVARSGIVYATPAFLCLIAIEMSDIVFSFDSVPAIIAITREPFLVYAAVIFAILGLRNLYFMLAAASKYLSHLDTAVALVLAFVAIKLGASAVEKTFGIETFHISPTVSLWIVLGLISAGVVASLSWPEKKGLAALEEAEPKPSEAKAKESEGNALNP